MATFYVTESGVLHRCALTQREREILSLIHEGYQQYEIAFITNTSLASIEKHLSNSFKKLGARNRNEALNLAGFV